MPFPHMKPAFVLAYMKFSTPEVSFCFPLLSTHSIVFPEIFPGKNENLGMRPRLAVAKHRPPALPAGGCRVEPGTVPTDTLRTRPLYPVCSIVSGENVVCSVAVISNNSVGRPAGPLRDAGARRLPLRTSLYGIRTHTPGASSPYKTHRSYYADCDLASDPEGLEKYLEVRREQQSREKRGRSDAGSSKLISDDKPDNSPPPKMGKFPKM